MNILKVITVILLSMFFNINQTQEKVALKHLKIETPKRTTDFTIYEDDYTITFKIEQTKTEKHNLVIAMTFHSNSYITTNTTGNSDGKLHVNFGDYFNLNFKGDLKETRQYGPQPVDSCQNGNIVYTQALEIKSNKDFEVFGRIQFTMAPKHKFEEMPFAISYKNGVMSIYYPKC
jgi:hypothetical protein